MPPAALRRYVSAYRDILLRHRWVVGNGDELRSVVAADMFWYSAHLAQLHQHFHHVIGSHASLHFQCQAFTPVFIDHAQGLNSFAEIQGVWVTTPLLAMSLGAALQLTGFSKCSCFICAVDSRCDARSFRGSTARANPRRRGLPDPKRIETAGNLSGYSGTSHTNRRAECLGATSKDTDDGYEYAVRSGYGTTRRLHKVTFISTSELPLRTQGELSATPNLVSIIRQNPDCLFGLGSRRGLFIEGVFYVQQRYPCSYQSANRPHQAGIRSSSRLRINCSRNCKGACAESQWRGRFF
jgi:hypothetical protein